jgi:hypothetical protein
MLPPITILTAGAWSARAELAVELRQQLQNLQRALLRQHDLGFCSNAAWLARIVLWRMSRASGHA